MQTNQDAKDQNNFAFERIVHIKSNKDLAGRTIASLTVFLIYLVFVFATPFFKEHAIPVLLMGGIVLSSLVLRVAVAKIGLSSDSVICSKHWLRNYSLSTLFMSLTWAAFIVTTFVYYGVTWVFLLLVLSTAGIAASATSTLAPNATLARSYVLMLIVPNVILGFVEGTRQSMTLSGLLLIYVVALVVLVRDSSHQYWTSLNTIERLNLQKGALEKVIHQIGENSATLNEASLNLSTISGQMVRGAQSMSVESRHVAQEAGAFNVNAKRIAESMQLLTEKTDHVANSIEGMTTTISSVSKTTQNTKFIAKQAVEQAHSATTKVSELGQSAQEVGKISEAIKEISEQTNLLALNATIEAARAGEAGKGFSVVANEIKELANQTAEATLKIKHQIDTIQRVISETVAQIGSISEITTQIDTSISTSADVVDEQSATTQAIAATVTEASREISEISTQVIAGSETADRIAQGISAVSQAADEVAGSSGQVDTSSETLMQLANGLNEIVLSRQ